MSTGGAVKLTIDNDKVGYVRLPNGGILTTVAGVIDTTYTGVGGKITYYVPKTSTQAVVENSGLSGIITTNFENVLSFEGSNGISSITAIDAEQINCRDMALLTTVIDGSLLSIAASGSALTAKSIGDILYAAYIDNREDVVYDFSGGTNASEQSVDGYMLDTYGIGTQDIETVLEMGLGGIITFN